MIYYSPSIKQINHLALPIQTKLEDMFIIIDLLEIEGFDHQFMK
jgi:hypothetical protein